MGLTEGSRKHQDLIVERHCRRLGQLNNLVLQRVRDRAGRIVNRGLLLRERAQTLLRQTEIQVGQRGLRAVVSTDVRLRTKEHELRSLPRRVQAAGFLVDRVERNLAEKGKRLEALDPARLLDRGYSVTRTSAGRLVRSSSDVEPGERIHTQLRDGTLVSRILSAEEQAND